MSSASYYEKETMTKGVSLVAAAIAMPEVIRLEERVNSLEKIVNSLRLQIRNMQAQQAMEKTISVKEIIPPPSIETINAVASCLREKGEAYPSDIADKLGIGLMEVFAAISILRK